MGNTVRLYDILQLLDPRSFIIIIGKPTVESKLENSPLHCGYVEDILSDITVGWATKFSHWISAVTASKKYTYYTRRGKDERLNDQFYSNSSILFAAQRSDSAYSLVSRNIRRGCNYSDCLICSFVGLRILCASRIGGGEGMTLKEQLDVLPLDQKIVIRYAGVNVFVGKAKNITLSYETVKSTKVLFTKSVGRHILIEVTL